VRGNYNLLPNYQLIWNIMNVICIVNKILNIMTNI
jgi:hypothetical protein